jgi:hypothetical protein
MMNLVIVIENIIITERLVTALPVLPDHPDL